MKHKTILLGLTRLAMGWIFFWAFLDKLFGLGFATPAERAWVAGGSPTKGFLTNAVKGPFASFYGALAGSAAVDWLFMGGLLLIGIALLLGIGVRLAAAGGILMMLLMYTAGFMPPANNPVVDDHIVYALVLGILAVSRAGTYAGFGLRWAKLPIVKKHLWLE